MIVERALLCLVMFGGVSRSAMSGEVRIPLPELVGSYELNDFSLLPFDVMPPRGRSTQIQTGIFLEQVEQFSIELTGVITFGEVTGDGIVRQSVLAPLRGTLSPSLSIGGSAIVLYGEVEAAEAQAEGAIHRLVTFPVSEVAPPATEPPFDLVITVWLTSGTLTEIPYVVPPPPPLFVPDTNGVLIAMPLRAEVTSAALILEGVAIPEPSAGLLWGIATVFVAMALKHRQRSIPGRSRSSETCTVIHRLRIAVTWMVVLCWGAVSAHGAPRYSITALDVLPGGLDSLAFGLNDSGQIVGDSRKDTSGNVGQSRPVVWDYSGHPTPLWSEQQFGGSGGNLADINNAAQVVGRYGSGSGIVQPTPGVLPGRAFVWSADSGRIDLSLDPFGFSMAAAINEHGQVVGTSEILDPVTFDLVGIHPFIWDATSGIRDLGTAAELAVGLALCRC